MTVTRVASHLKSHEPIALLTSPSEVSSSQEESIVVPKKRSLEAFQQPYPLSPVKTTLAKIVGDAYSIVEDFRSDRGTVGSDHEPENSFYQNDILMQDDTIVDNHSQPLIEEKRPVPFSSPSGGGWLDSRAGERGQKALPFCAGPSLASFVTPGASDSHRRDEEIFRTRGSSALTSEPLKESPGNSDIEDEDDMTAQQILRRKRETEKAKKSSEKKMKIDRLLSQNSVDAVASLLGLKSNKPSPQTGRSLSNSFLHSLFLLLFVRSLSLKLQDQLSAQVRRRAICYRE